MQTPQEILQHYWGYSSFRPGQEDVIEHVLQGRDTLAILPTGGGKSLCYQVPALLNEGLCLVISPLIALMKDQEERLINLGIEACAVNNSMTRSEVEDAYRKVSTGTCKFLFVSPERLRSALFLDYLSDWHINLVAVDEAHCISQWGYDFRPPYLQIADLRHYLPDVPFLALTASATPLVQKDIAEKLKFHDPQVVFTSFARPNLSLSAFEVEDKIVKLRDILQKVPGSGIVYCRSRKRTRELAETLTAQGIRADFYHAGLRADIRSQKQTDWSTGRMDVMVCTNAFGMGIDKSNVRVVVHYDLPDTPEAYYQEAGRAGRDGKKAYAVLLYRQKDLHDLEEGIQLRYPSEDVMKSVYTDLCDYLSIPLGGGNGEVFDLELEDFYRKFKQNPMEVQSTLKLLEMQEFWKLSDSMFLPSRVHVMANRSLLDDLEQHHPALDEVLKQLLRMYGGLLNHYIPIQEWAVAQKIGIAKDYVTDMLEQLHHHGIIDYIPATDKPQLFFLHQRVAARDLQIDLQTILRQKKQYTERVRFMISSTADRSQCRARKLVQYFGEELGTDCGCCDNCIGKAKKKHTADFESLKNTILHEIALKGTLNIDSFCRQHNSTVREELMRTLRYLLDDGVLCLDSNGDARTKT